MSEPNYEALTRASNARQYHHRLLYDAVNRGDMAAAERHTDDYLAASAEEGRVEAEFVKANK